MLFTGLAYGIAAHQDTAVQLEVAPVVQADPEDGDGCRPACLRAHLGAFNVVVHVVLRAAHRHGRTSGSTGGG